MWEVFVCEFRENSSKRGTVIKKQGSETPELNEILTELFQNDPDKGTSFEKMYAKAPAHDS